MCFGECGIWITAPAAPTVFERSELSPSRLTSWRHAKAACPQCTGPMILHGHDMALFLGCETHGFWVDADAIKQTGLGRVAVAPRLRQARAVVAERARAERAAREQEERARRDQAEQAARSRRERDREHEVRLQARQRERAEREAACAPYIAIARAAIKFDDVLPLAEKLMELDRALAAINDRVQVLERR